MRESLEQIALFSWARFATPKYPALRLLAASANGGLRNKITAARLKREGVRPGFPDVILPVPCGGYHGLFIELKRPKEKGIPAGKVSPEQVFWLGELQAVGNCAGVAYGWEEARAMIEAYLSGQQ